MGSRGPRIQFARARHSDIVSLLLVATPGRFMSESAENGIEEIRDLSLENKRQECLNESEFIEYIDYLDPWTLDVLLANYNPESEDKKYEHMGNNILAHVVYTLLELKYPLPAKKVAANLPDYSAKSLVIDIPNASIDSAMQKLLNKKNIFVLRVESCVDFCLRQYKTEMIGSIDISLAFEKLAESAKEENTKEFHKNLLSQRKLSSNKSEVLLITHDHNSKQTQTPKAIPEEDIVLSKAAYLGKQAFEILSSGDSLPNDLIASMLAEYIKDQKDIRGFVILNYPNTYSEAQILEEIFSGKKPPDDFEYVYNDESILEESIECQIDNIEDPLKEYRKSKILKLDKIGSENTLTSYFNSYIKLKKSEKIDKEIFIWDLEKENSESVDRFYSEVGVNYSMYYEDIDKTQLALICRYVIGDYEFPIKSDDELFGTNVLDELEFPAENKKPKSKVIKPESSNNKNGKQNKDVNTKSNLITNSDAMQMDTEHVSKVNLMENVVGRKSSRKSSTSIGHNITWKDAKETLAGDENWEYSKIKIAEKLGLELASCWEEIEKCYVNNIQQLLLSKRLQMHCLVPYTTFVCDKMKHLVMHPSPKQDLVCKFLQEYNNIEDDWRENNITRNEWHCRVKELKNRLYDICDERKQYSEEEKHSIISENWICDELIVLANTYVSLMQTELNRFILTYQILHDYYISMVSKPLSQRLPLKELNKHERNFAETASTTKTRASEEKYRLLKEAFLDLQLRNINIDNHNNPLNVFIDDNVKLAHKIIQEISESYKTLIGHETNDLVSKFQNASSSSLKKRVEKDFKILGDSVEVQKFEYLKCMQEWKMGCMGETCRANLRITILQKKCYEDMQIFCDQIFNAFKNIQDYIDDIYLNEIKSVDSLSKYLQMAIETNRKIPENLLLTGDTLVIDFNVLQMQSVINSESDIPEEVTGEMEFKLCQLALLQDSFKIVAPTGITIQQAFIYVLQDFVVFGKESCKGPTFPLTWRRIDPERIPEFVFSIFGENLYVDWRDFLIYCLNIPFPTTDELLDIRKKLRCQESESKELIDREIFLSTPLWFENSLDDIDKTSKLRNTLLKHFLFELFEVSKDVMNYTALLLAFCKAKNPKEGFSKALALALGKKVCYSTEECEEAVNNLIKAKKSKDQAYEDTNNLLDLIIHNVLDICTGTILLELNDNETKPVRKGKGKMSRRSKTSARLSHAEINKPVFSQSSPEKSEIKMIFMNPVKGKSVTGYNKEKEQKEGKPDDYSDIIYSVSRTIIWKVLEICVPWHLKLFNQDKCTYKVVINDVIDQMEKYNEDKSIYVCKFLAEPKICKFLHKIKKFSKPDINEEILKILEE
ncbi:sperm flagellar protein 2-like [Aricia agestis]|uniref:sperm flagellar protein 2-like n=1 Tax=Aricia agestis TaxID=91739 RepID=UPI001C20B2DD|nr:sperm flagellar protein 2-like [Aricia agestis]